MQIVTPYQHHSVGIRSWRRERARLQMWAHYAARDPILGTADDYDAIVASLLTAWRSDTGHLSSMTSKILHPAYQRLIGLGRPAVPAILRYFEASPTHLSWALRAITGADPVPPGDAGNLRKEQQAWLQWGQMNR